MSIRRFVPLAERLEGRRLLTALPVFSTGVGDTGSLAPPGSMDLHFALVSAPPGVALQSFIMDSLPPEYVANTASSQWIGPSANPFIVTNTGDYDYRTTFDLSGFDPATAVLHLQLASDNDSKVLLNGQDTGIAIAGTPNTYNSLHAFDLTTGFVLGLNQLDVVVHNDFSATGVQLGLTGEATPADLAPPVLTSAVSTVSSTTVTGTVQAQPQTTYQVQYFISPSNKPRNLGTAGCN